MLFRLTRDERGFTMVTVIGALLVVTMLAVMALSYAQSDLPRGGKDRDRKIAYAAAEAGAQNYFFYLNQDTNFWSKCADAATAVEPPYTVPQQINQRWTGTGPDPRRWVQVPDTTDAWYTIELLPANGRTACDPASAEASMIDTTTGTFSIRTTGRKGTDGVKRSIVTNFRRQSLLDYVWFTDKETPSPVVAPVQVGTRATRTPSGCSPGPNCLTIKQWSLKQCNRYYGNVPEGTGVSGADGGRQNQTFSGQYQADGGPAWTTYNPSGEDCSAINFGTSDVVAGPLHTNDEFSCSGTPDFGLAVTDRIETASLGQTAKPALGYRGGTCSPNFIGTHVRSAPPVAIPKTNDILREETAALYRFVGRTQITMHGTTMNVIGQRENGTILPYSAALPEGQSMPIPPDGVIYVSNRIAGRPIGGPAYTCGGYDVVQPGLPEVDAALTGAADACGNLEIKGNYSVNVTLTAQNDVIIMDDINRPGGSPVPNPDVLLGLIATGFVRIHHPVTGCGTYGCNVTDTCTNAAANPAATPPTPASPTNISIDAAILSLNQSFMLDNYHCGAHLGTLTVRGAIAQNFRGTVGLSTGEGYTKAYSYDTRLRFRSPPKFLDPVQSAWRIQTYNEEIPAR